MLTLILIASVSACAPADEDNAAAPQVTVTATPSPPATVTVSATPTPETPSEEAPTEEAPPAEESFVMPKVVGMVLQDAQDTLQMLGSYVMDQQDARGLDRLQLNDSNWKVCSQKPRAGAKVAASDVITLASVKLSENCP